ncbi:MAG TPA: E3 binding domain-containing protein [Rubrobacteraceae bacterium]|nr:E3 binding domain-containing protein [Rubrobacteraceae bacterium]
MPPEESNAQEESQHSAEETVDTGTPGEEAGGRNSQQTRSTDETPDVTLDVPTLNLEEAHLQVDNLRARISLQAELADMVRINVGVDAFLEKVELDLNGLEAQTLLKANLENVRGILVRTLESLDNNPDLIESLAQAAGNSGKTLEGVAGDVANEESQENQEDGEEPDEESVGEIEATDAARSKAEALGVDLAQVEGTGSGGRIIARDVQQAAKQA